MAFEVGDSSSIRILKDAWCLEVLLKLAYLELFYIATAHAGFVADFYLDHGSGV